MKGPRQREASQPATDPNLTLYGVGGGAESARIVLDCQLLPAV